MSDITKEKLRKSALTQWERQRAEGYQYPPLSAESRAKISATLKTKRIPDDVKQKISKALKGKRKPPMQEATKQKIREARAKQAPISDDGRRRISEFHSNREYVPHSEEAKRKIREARAKQAPISVEARAELSQSQKLAWRKRKWMDRQLDFWDQMSA
jgi:hypothetical protein